VIPEGTVDLQVLARVLAKFRYQDTRVEMGSIAAWITCEISDEMRKLDPDWGYLRFWEVIAREQRAAQQRKDN